MKTNIEKYKKDLAKLISEGNTLLTSMRFECYPKEFEEEVKKQFKGKEFREFKKALPFFKNNYQSWYSEALAIVSFLLPNRVSDFVKLYEAPKNRKAITFENYVIEDYLQGLAVTRGWEKEIVVGPYAAIPLFKQQVKILESANKRFESSLFDIRQLIQADVFDSELDAATELNKKGFARGAGAIAGVVLEGHLSQICMNHKLSVKKKNPTINDFNQLLKDNEALEIKEWRFIQHLADLRNLCDHKKKKEPTKEDIEELITGVEKITKTLF